MTHLEQLHIENFRPFKSFHWDNLKQINLIGGKNNVGKTALMEAIRILNDPKDANLFTQIIAERGGWNKKTGELDKDAIFSFGNSFNLNNNDFVPLSKAFIRLSEGVNMFFDNYSVPISDRLDSLPFYRLKNFGFINSNIFQDLTYLWDSIELTPKEDVVKAQLRLLLPDLLDIRVTDGSTVKVRLKGESVPRNLASFGDGMQRLFTIALGLVNAQDSVLVIDEFEMGLHYSIQQELWAFIFRVAKELNVQVFATTHSNDTIETFTRTLRTSGNEHIGQFTRLSRKIDGSIVPVSYDYESLETAMLNDIETR